MSLEYVGTAMRERASSATTKNKATKEKPMSTKEQFVEENRVYIVAGVHPKDGVVKLNTGNLYTLREAQERAKELNATCEAERARLGLLLFVAYNTTAVSMDPPYYIEMAKEFSSVLDHMNESDYKGMEVSVNNNAEGSITWH